MRIRSETGVRRFVTHSNGFQLSFCDGIFMTVMEILSKNLVGTEVVASQRSSADSNR